MPTLFAGRYILSSIPRIGADVLLAPVCKALSCEIDNHGEKPLDDESCTVVNNAWERHGGKICLRGCADDVVSRYSYRPCEVLFSKKLILHAENSALPFYFVMSLLAGR